MTEVALLHSGGSPLQINQTSECVLHGFLRDVSIFAPLGEAAL